MATKINNIENLLRAAKTKLMREQPFFSVLISQMPLHLDETIPTACTNGDWIKINPQFLRSIPPKTIPGLLAHEALHAAFLHMSRIQDRDPEIFNWAADVVINPLIIDQGIPLPEGALFGNFFGIDIRNKTAEAVYEELKAKHQKDRINHPEDYWDDLAPAKGAKDASGKKRQENEAKQRLAAARQAAQKAGKYGGDLQRLIDETLTPKIDWRDQLRQFSSERAHDDYSWRRPNRRFSGSDIFLPVLHSERLPPLAICVDTSGSINQKILNEFAAEINAIREDCMPSKTFIFYVDTDIRHAQILEAEDTWVPDPKGGGGTMFSKVWGGMEKHTDGIDPCATIFFTDMYCDDWGEDPGHPVLWVDWEDGASPYKPDFGEIIRIPS